MAIASVALDGRVLDANRALLAASGFTLGELQGQPFAAFVDLQAADSASRVFASLAAGDVESYSASRKYRTKSGGWLDVDLRVSLVRDVQGRPESCLAVLQDVSAHRRALEEAARVQEALRMSEARYRALVEQSPLSIQILSPDGRTLQVNAAWERLWGLRLSDLADYNMLDDQQLVDRGLMDHIRRGFAGEAVRVPVAPYTPRRGAERREPATRWVRAVMYPLLGPDGRITEVVLIHEDITDQVRADEARHSIERDREMLLAEAQRATLDAEAASRVKDEFLATLSHELRTPLNAVLGWVRILRKREVTPQVTSALDVIERNARAQARLVDDLLDMSRIITGNIRLNMQLSHVAPVVTAAVDSIRPAAEAKGLRLQAEVPDSVPPIVCDPERLQQILWNLLSNAVKFNESGGEVALSVSCEPGTFRIVVSDTGIGIAPHILPYVFDRFRQGDSSTTRAYPGLGLGLAIVRHLVELHGGTVSAESIGPGGGATFTVLLPLGR